MENVVDKGLTCEWMRHSVVNYAMQQNYVPIVQKITLGNHSDRSLHDVRLTVASEPEFAAVWTKSIDTILPGQTIEISTVPIEVSGVFLANLTERLAGTLTLEVTCGQEVVYRDRSPLSVLAYDQWAGLAIMPEMAAAFIMPNHPVIARIIREAAPYLEKWTGSSAFDAYQTNNPNRVRHQAAAVYSAIQAMGVIYCVAPASFEEIGQRVRLPDDITGNKLGNCLDLTLLYAACLEAIGLYPLVVFTEGHAFAGVWLIQESFSESVQDDGSLLTKRLAAGVHEISLVEATLMCEGSKASYQEAEQKAATHLDKPESFFGFVDVRRARASSIRPLPIRIRTATGYEIAEETGGKSPAAEEAPEDLAIHVRPTEVSAIAVTKQKQWERKLLDLTLRNTLLNFRHTKSALPLLHTRLGELEDALSEGQEFQLLPKPSDWDNTLRSAELFRGIGKDHPLGTLIYEEFRNKRLRGDVNERELADKTVHLYRSAKLSIEENGANTLYLALGLLKWYESAASELPRYAPIVLVPVELVRKSSRAGFVLRVRDEEPQINITLLEMLRQDFGSHIGGLDPLPRDEKGIDLAGIFTTIRHVIMTMPRWDVVETAILGLFSFSRFVMWNDIRSRSEELARNKVVASLMAGRMEWEQPETFPDAGKLDELYAPDQLLLPISADSSQISAVSAAGSGKSFVLHGPPGTGKSQTITNMIASALASGKTVLFVAEKMAALSVVQSRLESIGLGAFCLELHSNKSTKKAVLEQLRRTLETARTASPEEWRRTADRLAASRQELNRHVEALHKSYGFGSSLYEAITRYGMAKTAPSVIAFEPSVVGGMNKEDYAAWSDLVRELAVAGEATGHPHGHVWSDASVAAYHPQMRSQAEELLASYQASIAGLSSAYGAIHTLLAYPAEQPASAELARVEAVARELQLAPSVVPVGLLRAADPEAAGAEVLRAIRHGKARDEAKGQLLKRFTADVLAFDAGTALQEWKKAELQWFLPRLLKQNRIFKLLKGKAIAGAALQKNETEQLLGQIVLYQTEAAALKGTEAVVAPLLGTLWNGGEADWNAVQAAHAWTLSLGEKLLQLHQELPAAQQARERLADAYAAGRGIFDGKHGEALTNFIAAYREFGQREEQLTALLRLDLTAMDRKSGEQPWFEFRAWQAQAWQENLGSLRDWTAWRQVRERALAAGLTSVTSAYESGLLGHGDLQASFEQAWNKAAIAYILETDPQLASFSGRLFEEKIKSFQETMERFEQLTREEIAARLAANIPSIGNQAASSSEAGILLRAIRSGGRGLSLRKLFEQIPNLLNRLCPCVLMSPMSVAQYLDPKYAPFDLVVFDEASQLPTSEAVGAMARGRNVIVVGDPKQLPPTSFFSSAGSEEEDDAVVPEDLESILEDCLALGMPQDHLLWHYRSRHESLIAFSNRHFYENKLLTFPSPSERQSSVKWHPVGGFYDRGKTKQNRAEAEAVVAEIARRLKDPVLGKRSIGVVTFNSIQQTLIEDMLDEAFRRDPELETAAARLYEPIFVKNLENVQGDERDVILFSIGYGPDAAGKVVLNFGPLNRDGGWRRLNVAVSRARHEMHVFSTLRADHLDVSRTRAEGVGALRSFLEYAEKGTSALGVGVEEVSSRIEGIERAIAEALEAEGYKVDLHVGTSGYRMDLAIVDPDQPDTYLLAVLCDGSGYKTGKTARDREVLRGQVLRQLGWSIHRVWAMDWLDNPEKEIQRIVASVKVAKERKVAGGVNAASESAVAERNGGDVVVAEKAAAERDGADIVIAGENTAVLRKSADVAIAAENAEAIGKASSALAEGTLPSNAVGSSEETVALSSVETVKQASDSAPTSRWRASYQAVSLPPVSKPSEEFYSANSSGLVKEQMMQVIEGEGPISRSLLTRRVIQAWGMTRSGARIERHLDSLLTTLPIQTTMWESNTYYWSKDADPSQYGVYRISDNESERRSAEELPPEEVAVAVHDVLFVHGSLTADDLVRETVKQLGYARTGAALDRVLRNGIQVAVSRGLASEEEGRVSFRAK